MVSRISRDELKDRLDRTIPTTLVEALPPMYYEDAHLPGALNINHDQVDALAPTLLPDKDAEIVVYCANTPCPNSELAAERLARLGYTRVFEYVEGKQDWIEAGYPTESGPAPSPAPEAKPETPETKADTREQVRQLVALVEQGRFLDAFDAFYADDVTMQENGNPPTVGKAANRTREEQFVGYVAEIRENRAASVIVDGDRSVINWVAEYTGVDGKRLRFDQVAHQTWRDGKIISERFFYDSAALA
ncbi:MAG: nuclear transport factor 2 family protein [Armatimonadetes bacterium]|nr:nuclear transport factor 2 family protein [Armatimonadota bacterium]